MYIANRRHGGLARASPAKPVGRVNEGSEVGSIRPFGRFVGFDRSPSEDEPSATTSRGPLFIKISINDPPIRSSRHLSRHRLEGNRARQASLQLTEASCWTATGWTYDGREKNLGADCAGTTDRFTIIRAIISLARTCTRFTAR